MASIDGNKPWVFNRIPILSGRAEIFQTKTSGGNWQFRYRVSGEKKYVRRSLRTPDKASALKLAEEEVLAILQEERNGKKVFSLKLHELAEEYIKYRRKEDLEEGHITSGRLTTINTHINHFVRFKNKGKERLSQLDRRCAYDYPNYRIRSGTKAVTIKNEQASINHMIGWAFEEGYCNFPKLEFKKLRNDAGRRATFEPDEFVEFYDFLNEWAVSETDIRAANEKQVVRCFILILAESMVRVGELRGLKWKNVASIDWQDPLDQQNKDPLIIEEPIAKIIIPEEISKVRKTRTVLARAGILFNHMKRLTRHNSPNDYIFTEVCSNKQFSKRRLYSYWNELMEGFSGEFDERKISYYSLRHWGITNKLLSDCSIWEVAKMAGTSVTQIEKHYDHGEIEAQRKMLAKDGGAMSVYDLCKRLSK